MHKPLTLLTLTAIAFGGFSVAPAEETDRERQVGEVQRNGEVRAEAERDRDRDRAAVGLEVSDTEATHIRGTLLAMTEAALTPRELRSVAQRLSTPDQVRVWSVMDQAQPELDRLIEQVREAWRDRYDTDFLIRDREAAYPPEEVQIRRGITREVILAAGQMGPQRDRADRERDQVDRDRVRDRDRDRERAERRTDRPQEHLVTVIFPSTDLLPEVHVPLVNEGLIRNVWRLDIPLHVDGETVRQNLRQNMIWALEQRDRWPEDVNEGYRMATHLALLALYDIQPEADAAHRAEREDESPQRPAAGRIEIDVDDD